MTTYYSLPSDLLPLLATAFPHTFFTDPRQVQPLKLDIHQELYAALPAGVGRRQTQRFLHWYVSRAVYQKALLQGKGRIDLTGAVVDTDIPAEIREQARERWQQLQQARPNPTATNPTGNPRPVKPVPRVASGSAVPTPIAPLNLENLYAMAVDAKLEVTLKFTTLPHAQPAGRGKMAFALKTPDGQWVTAEVGNKVWNKLTQAAAEWPAWTAALVGAMGPRTERGFTLANPGLQVFERKPKASAQAMPPRVKRSQPR